MDIEQAKLDPATVFRRPQDVLRAEGMSLEDKKAILLRWEEDAEALIRATEEGMPPADNRGPGELLAEVQAALQSLASDNRS
ncbi:MAG: hypothetical protein ACOYB4_03585 [Methyloceanibacter sp.]